MLALAPAVVAAYQARGYSEQQMEAVAEAKARRARMAATSSTPIKQVLALTNERPIARMSLPDVGPIMREAHKLLEVFPEARAPSLSLNDGLMNKIETIQRACSRFYGVSRVDMLSARRTAVVVKPRQVAMFLSKTLTLRSLPEIGRRFGGRDHTTALHAFLKIGALVETDEKLRGEIAQIKALLGVEG